MKLCLFNLENFFLLTNPNPKTSIDVYKKPEEKILGIAKTVKQIDADIYMFCEVGGFTDLDYFNTKYLNDNYQVYLLPGNSDRGIEMGFMINKKLSFDYSHYSNKDRPLNFLYPHEKIENEKAQKNNLSLPYNSHKFSRDISELHISSNNQIKLIILLVHLKSKWDRDGHDPQGNLRRTAECNELIKKYHELKKLHNNIPIIISGDFNGVATKNECSPEFFSIYQETDLQDVLELANLPKEERTSFVHFNREKNSVESYQLDYIFIPKSLAPFVNKEESGIYQFLDANGRPIPKPQDSFQRYQLPSDHYPIICSLNY